MSQVSHWLFSPLSRPFSLFWPFSSTTRTSPPTGVHSICPSWQLLGLLVFHNKALARALNRFCHPAVSKMLREEMLWSCCLGSPRFSKPLALKCCYSKQRHRVGWREHLQVGKTSWLADIKDKPSPDLLHPRRTKSQCSWNSCSEVPQNRASTSRLSQPHLFSFVIKRW